MAGTGKRHVPPPTNSTLASGWRSGLRQTQPRKPHEICGNCEQAVATLHCAMCESKFCPACAKKIHSSKAMQKHQLTAVQGRSSSQKSSSDGSQWTGALDQLPLPKRLAQLRQDVQVQEKERTRLEEALANPSNRERMLELGEELDLVKRQHADLEAKIKTVLARGGTRSSSAPLEERVARAHQGDTLKIGPGVTTSAGMIKINVSMTIEGCVSTGQRATQLVDQALNHGEMPERPTTQAVVGHSVLRKTRLLVSGEGVTLTLRNLVIMQAQGCAVVATHGAKVIIERCVISDCSAGVAAAAQRSTIEASHSAFFSRQTSQAPGVLIRESSQLRLDQCVLMGGAQGVLVIGAGSVGRLTRPALIACRASAAEGGRCDIDELCEMGSPPSLFKKTLPTVARRGSKKPRVIRSRDIILALQAGGADQRNMLGALVVAFEEMPTIAPHPWEVCKMVCDGWPAHPQAQQLSLRVCTKALGVSDPNQPRAEPDAVVSDIMKCIQRGLCAPHQQVRRAAMLCAAQVAKSVTDGKLVVVKTLGDMVAKERVKTTKDKLRVLEREFEDLLSAGIESGPDGNSQEKTRQVAQIRTWRRELKAQVRRADEAEMTGGPHGLEMAIQLLYWATEPCDAAVRAEAISVCESAVKSKEHEIRTAAQRLLDKLRAQAQENGEPTTFEPKLVVNTPMRPTNMVKNSAFWDNDASDQVAEDPNRPWFKGAAPEESSFSTFLQDILDETEAEEVVVEEEPIIEKEDVAFDVQVEPSVSDELAREYLCVTVDKCAGLKDLETVSTSDPFVKVILKQPNGTIQEFKTAVKDGELNPKYKETFEFEMTEIMRTAGVHEATLTFEVWDDNNVSDDMMGQADFPLSEFISAPTSRDTVTLLGGGSEVGEYGTLTYDAKRETGAEKTSRIKQLDALRKKVEFVTVNVKSCAGLKDLETVSTSDPFVKVILKQPNGKVQEFKTAVKDGELNPEYNETFQFNSNAAMRTAGELEATLTFEVWDDNNVSDDMMGQISYQLSELSVAPDPDGAQAITRTDALEGEGSDDYGTLTSMTVGETAEQRAERVRKAATSQSTATGHQPPVDPAKPAATLDLAAPAQFAMLQYLSCGGSRGEWQGKVVGSDRWDGVTYDFVRNNFKPWFVDQCRRRHNQETKVPAGSASVGQAEMDNDLNGNGEGGLTTHLGRPEVKFQQGKADTCVFSGAASALQYVGDSKGATALSKMITTSAKCLDPMGELWSVVTDQTAWDVEGISEATYDVLQPRVDPTCIQIKCSDGQVDHCVTTVGHWIFDANRQYALPLCQHSFDQCAGEGATFVGCVRVFAFVPSKKLIKALAKKRKRVEP